MARRPPQPSEQPSLFDAPANRPGSSGAAGSADRRHPASRAGEPEPEQTPALAEPEEPVLSVSELTTDIRARLEGFGRLRVEGELSGLRRASSGHLYFDLKDEGARLACVVWRSQVGRALRFEPEEGMQIIVRGKLDVYAPRGSYSLIVDKLEPRGIGALLAQLERLKAELAALGRFDRSRPLPRMPRRVGIVTSRDGAALRDVLRTRSLRWPAYPLRLFHAPVQGPGAAAEIAEGIARLDRSGVDVILVCRGGGSLEDLWSFNERVVAQAIWEASVPVVSGVGHETDTTLADLVADHRAHTPTDAAQTVFPSLYELRAHVQRAGEDLIEAFGSLWNERHGALERLRGRPVLRDANWILDERSRRVASMAARLRGAVRTHRSQRESRLRGLFARLERQSPRARVERWLTRLLRSRERLRSAGERSLERVEHRFQRAAAELESISPLRVLARGYSLTRKQGMQEPLRSALDVAVGDELETRLADGRLRSRVTEVEGAGEHDARAQGPSGE